MNPSFTLRRRLSRTSYTDDDDQLSRMSDVEECPQPPLVRRRSSCTSIPPASPSSSSYKMSVDSDDARSISSVTTLGGTSNSNSCNNNNRYRNRILRHWQNETADILPPSITIGSPFNNSNNNNNTNSSNTNNTNNNNNNNNINNSSSSNNSNSNSNDNSNSQQQILWQTNTLLSMRQNSQNKLINNSNNNNNNRNNSSESMMDSPSPNTSLTKISPLSLNQQQLQQQISKPMDIENLKPSTSGSLRASRSTSSLINYSKDPERRTVRRSSLLPKSKALSRVMNQAEEETHLSELEMRREQCATQQLKENNGQDHNDIRPPPANWIHLSASAMSPVIPHASLSTSSIPSSASSSPSMIPYQSSRLNPELEMTNFQLDNLPSPIQSLSSSFRSVKRKASEERLDSFFTATSSSLKRRAVSPSISLTGSPILTAIASPPTSNAAARAQQKPNQNSGFNLYEASGGLSRMSLSE